MLFRSVVPLERRSFNKQLLCNGRLEAVKRSNVSFQSSGIIAKINVKEGDAVSKGDALAQLDRESLESSMKSAQLSYDKSLINLADRLLDYGYTLSDTALIPADTRRTIYINTGYAFFWDCSAYLEVGSFEGTLFRKSGRYQG